MSFRDAQGPHIKFTAACSVISLTMLVAVAISSCVARAPSGIGTAEVSVGQGSNGSSVSLHPGDRLIVILPGNPSTGFNWTVAAGTDHVLVQQGEPVFTRNSNALGASGRCRFVFTAAARGKTAVTLVYRRPFEPESPPAVTFEVTVEISE